MTLRVVGISLLVLLAVALPSKAIVTLDYEDVGFDNSVNVDPDSKGFVHSPTMAVVDIGTGSPFAGSGPAFSGDYAALNDNGGDGSITRLGGGTFDFINLYIKGYSVPVSGVVEGYRSGLLVGSFPYSVTPSGWGNVPGNFQDIDELRIVQGSPGAFLIDNVSLNVVPEPTLSLLLLSCGFLFAVRCWRTT